MDDKVRLARELGPAIRKVQAAFNNGHTEKALTEIMGEVFLAGYKRGLTDGLKAEMKQIIEEMKA